MQAIITKFLSPTNHRVARVVAKAWVGKITVSWDHAETLEENHRFAALSLAEKYGWIDEKYTLAGGGLPDNTGFAFVVVER